MSCLLFEVLGLSAVSFQKFREMLNDRQKECIALRKDISERMNELAEVFSGSKPLSRVPKNGKYSPTVAGLSYIPNGSVSDKLRAWFTDIRDQIDQLTFDDVLSVGRKLVQLMRSLEEVRRLLLAALSFYRLFQFRCKNFTV